MLFDHNNVMLTPSEALAITNNLSAQETVDLYYSNNQPQTSQWLDYVSIGGMRL